MKIKKVKYKKGFVLFIDSDGYYHKKSIRSYNRIIREDRRLDFVASYNPFSIVNIKKWISKNNMNLELLSDTFVSCAKDKLKFKCGKGHIFEASWTCIKIGTRCPICANNIKHEYDYVKEYFEKWNYELISKNYESNNKYLEYVCNMHVKKGIQRITYQQLRSGHGCRYCGSEKYSNNRLLKESEENKKFLKELESKFTILNTEDVRYGSDIVKFEDSKGYEYSYDMTYFRTIIKDDITPNAFSTLNINTISNIKLYLSKTKSNFKLLSSEYKGSQYRMKFKCDKGHVFYKSWDNFRKRPKCTVCSISLGEKVVLELLQENKISFKPQYSINIKEYENTLKFDFGIKNKDDNIICIVEYDGEGHYQPIDWAGKGKEWAEKMFMAQKERDNIKDKYCKDNNIKLIRIPYWDFDKIEDILKQNNII